jgi:iron(III) transport system ATP-binding protein
MAHLEVSGLAVDFGGRVVLDGLDLRLERGAIGCLLGPSGCGKTTALRCIAGFEPVPRGQIRLDGAIVGAPGLTVPPERRRIGMVFQDYALFPHLDVSGNVGFGLRGMRAADVRARVGELLELVGLAAHAHKYPHELSGGQQQRVALARALAPSPSLLLLDEPFSNLDVELRERLSIELRDILVATRTTAVLVTHDQHEAFAIADQIGVMQAGRIEQWDTPYRLYHQPVNRFVADFIGQGAFVRGTVLGPNQVEVELGTLDSKLPLECTQGCGECGRGCRVDVLLRPDDVVHDDASGLRAEVVHKAFRGADILYTLRLASGARVLSLVPSHHDHPLGERIGIRLDVDHVVAFRDADPAPHLQGAHPQVRPIAIVPARPPA